MENLNQNAGRGRGRGALLLQIAVAQQESRGPSTSSQTTDSGLGHSIPKSIPAPLVEITENTGAVRPTSGSGRGRLLQDLVKKISSEGQVPLSTQVRK